MEIINWIEEEGTGTFSKPNLVAYSLIEAMSRVQGDIQEVFAPFNSEALQVEFKVNGVEVPFTWVCKAIQDSLDNLEEQAKLSVRKEALQKVQSQIDHMIWAEERS